MNTEFKASHFKSMEELLDTIETWLSNEEYYGTLYDDFNRFFDTGAMEEMYYYIKQLKEENKKLKKENTEYQDEIFARDNSWYDVQV